MHLHNRTGTLASIYMYIYVCVCIHVYIYIYIYVYIYHFDTLDQRQRKADKSCIAHLSVQYRKYRTVKCAI